MSFQRGNNTFFFFLMVSRLWCNYQFLENLTTSMLMKIICCCIFSTLLIKTSSGQVQANEAKYMSPEAIRKMFNLLEDILCWVAVHKP